MLLSHPLHQRYFYEWLFRYHSCRGGLEYLRPELPVAGYLVPTDRKRDTYLVPHPRESEDDFARRRLLAYYVNLCDPVVQTYASGVYAQGVSRTLPPRLEALTADMDLLGSSADRFFQAALYWTLCYGHVAVVVDSPRFQGAATAADEQAGALRPYAYVVPPTDILDWKLDDRGELEWIAVLETHARERAPLSGTTGNTATGAGPGRSASSGLYDVRVRVFRRESWELYDWSTEAHAGLGKLVDSGPLPLGRVPVAFSYHRPLQADLGEPFGESLIADIAYLNRALFNVCSLIDEQLYGVTFPQLFLPTDGSLTRTEELNLSLGRYQTYDGRVGTPVYISPSSEPINVLREQALLLARTIRQMAGLEASGAESVAARSGVALAWEHADLNRKLAAVADQIEQTEMRVWRLMALWAGEDPDAVKVDYPDEFVVEDASAEVERLTKELALRIGGTFNAEVKKHYARKRLAHLPADLLAAVEADIDDLDAGLPPEGREPMEPTQDGDGAAEAD